MEEKDTNYIKNLIMAIVASLMVIFFFELVFPSPKPPVTSNASEQDNASVAVPSTNTAAETGTIPDTASAFTPSVKPVPDNLTSVLSIKEALAKDDRIKIDTVAISGSIRLKGARLDDISLKQYRENMEKDSPNIVLFAPVGTDKPRYAEFGWVSSDTTLILPSSYDVWQASAKTLTVNTPVELTWTSPQGLRFTRIISIDDKYMMTITEKVENRSTAPVTLNNYGVVRRIGDAPKKDNLSYISYDGPIAVMNNRLEDIDYEKLMEEGKKALTTSEGGWIGITDKYWLSALVFEQSTKEVKANFIYNDMGGKALFQTDYMLSANVINAGEQLEVTNRIFVGAKEINALDDYSELYNIPRFDLAIDFGWYYFLTKPFLYILDFLFSILGNMGLAILVFAFFLRLLVYPIANKSYVSMQKMKLLQPKIKELSERYKGDKPKLSAEMMELYRKEKVNPASGCLPALIQIPIFFSLYKVLYIAIEMRQAPFYGWIHDLSAPDPTSVLTLFGLVNWPVPDFLNIGVWPIIMGITMYIQFKLNPKPADKTQAAIFTWMPIIFTFMLAHFASGLVIYWAWSNILAIIQQKTIIYRMEKKLKEHTKLKDIT